MVAGVQPLVIMFYRRLDYGLYCCHSMGVFLFDPPKFARSSNRPGYSGENPNIQIE